MCPFKACSITSDDADCIHCTKDSGIAEAARDALKDLDESLLNVGTNCEDTNEDSNCDDKEGIDIFSDISVPFCIEHTVLYRTTYCSSLIVAVFIRGWHLLHRY